jgi:hypothetical protein
VRWRSCSYGSLLVFGGILALFALFGMLRRSPPAFASAPRVAATQEEACRERDGSRTVAVPPPLEDVLTQRELDGALEVRRTRRLG